MTTLSIISPTGEGIRPPDEWGDGRFKSPRQSGERQYLHRGANFIGHPGQAIYMPANGQIIKEARPYAGDLYSGLLIKSGPFFIKMFYFLPHTDLLEYTSSVIAKTVIGTMQDISTKGPYKGMAPHIHLEITLDTYEFLTCPRRPAVLYLNPELFLEI